ncbi:hypothetical protein KY359_01355, partial [Candidatus Woesearchaeota archaeon]|nr:hypothetical protein [Candidatus Woesearchaeota archaeon]
MRRLIALAAIVATVGCGSIVRKFDDYDADNDSADAAGDVYLPDSSGDADVPDSAPDADDDITPDSDLDSIVDSDSTDVDTDGAVVCDSGLLSFLNLQGIDYDLGDVLLNGDGSFEAESARGWYRNSAAMDEYNIATGDYVVFSRETTGVPGMSGVTRIL